MSLPQVEFIIMGGTFMSMPEDYRTKFIAQLHNALSGFTGLDVDEAVRYSEQSKSKAIGITIETRPDYCLRPHLRQAPPLTRTTVSELFPLQSDASVRLYPPRDRGTVRV